MEKVIKSISPVQKRQIKGGGYKVVASGGQFPYTLAQAGAAAQNYSE